MRPLAEQHGGLRAVEDALAHHRQLLVGAGDVDGQEGQPGDAERHRQAAAPLRCDRVEHVEVVRGRVRRLRRGGEQEREAELVQLTYHLVGKLLGRLAANQLRLRLFSRQVGADRHQRPEPT